MGKASFWFMMGWILESTCGTRKDEDEENVDYD
jgi:hypothetical protein